LIVVERFQVLGGNVQGGCATLAMYDDDATSTTPARANVWTFLSFTEARAIAKALLDLAGSGVLDVTTLDLPTADLLQEREIYLQSLSYTEYLQTRHWRACKARAIERAGGACQVCNAADGLDVHHRTYERYGDEADGDLITLCRPCHRLFHANGKLARRAPAVGESGGPESGGRVQPRAAE